jgi:hypothetical protein
MFVLFTKYHNRSLYYSFLVFLCGCVEICEVWATRVNFMMTIMVVMSMPMKGYSSMTMFYKKGMDLLI